jgi:hypothetical protein
MTQRRQIGMLLLLEAQACFTEEQAAARRADLHNPTGARDFCLLLERGRLSGFLRMGDGSGPTAHLDEAITLARALGIQVVLARASTLLGMLGQRAVPHEAEAGAEIAIPAAGEAREAREALQRRSITGAALRREGDYWSLVYAGVTGQLKDMKGLHYLVQLLRHPGRDFHVIELVGQANGAVPDDPELCRAPSAIGLPLLDATAKAAYRRRLVELREDLAEAERFHEARRAERARAEADMLTEQLAAAVGLGGRDRSTGSTAERARTTVTHRLRAVIRRIAQHHPGLGDHLTARVRTGTFCSYQPDPERPIVWAVGEDAGV